MGVIKICLLAAVMAWFLVSVSGQQCQSALQAVTNLTNSQTAANVVYQSLTSELIFYVIRQKSQALVILLYCSMNAFCKYRCFVSPEGVSQFVVQCKVKYCMAVQ